MKNQLVLPCVRAVMGDWVIYTTAMSADEIAKRVTTDKKYRENKNLDNILQRDLKERRKNIAKYLMTDESRFFNSLIIGVFGGPPQWYQFNIDKKIEELEGKNSSLNYSHRVGFLEFTGSEEMFAIDGQHRVAGIQIAYEEDSRKISDKKILKDDQFPVIFIAHIDDEDGKKRTRKLFSDINKHAKGVSRGDTIKIDEENLSAIVTRRLYAKYKHFKSGVLISLTESEKLEKDDTTHFTNLLGIDSANKVLKKLFKKIPRTHEWNENNVTAFYAITEAFFNYIIDNVKEYQDFFVKKRLTISKARQNNSYLLFRPVGLKLLARLYVHYALNIEDGLNILRKKINKVGFIMPHSPLNELLWKEGKMKAREKNQKLAFELVIYILGNASTQREGIILEKYKEIMNNSLATLPPKIT